MKQIALAFNMYQIDQDGCFPSVYDDSLGYPAGRIIWADKIMPYIKNRDIFACPGGPNTINLTPEPGTWPNNLQGHPLFDEHGARLALAGGYDQRYRLGVD